MSNQIQELQELKKEINKLKVRREQELEIAKLTEKEIDRIYEKYEKIKYDGMLRYEFMKLLEGKIEEYNGFKLKYSKYDLTAVKILEDGTKITFVSMLYEGSSKFVTFVKTKRNRYFEYIFFDRIPTKYKQIAEEMREYMFSQQCVENYENYGMGKYLVEKNNKTL